MSVDWSILLLIPAAFTASSAASLAVICTDPGTALRSISTPAKALERLSSLVQRLLQVCTAATSGRDSRTSALLAATSALITILSDEMSAAREIAAITFDLKASVILSLETGTENTKTTKTAAVHDVDLLAPGGEKPRSAGHASLVAEPPRQKWFEGH